MDNIFKNTSYKILEQFMFEPSKKFSVRGLARELKFSHATILNHIDELMALDLIRKTSNTLYPTYYANTQSKKLRTYKRKAISFNILESGLIDYINKNTLPSSIVLYGSCAKGTFHEKSDIDLFVEANEIRLNLNRFEKTLNKQINLLFEKKLSNLSKELRNNLINGVIMEGYIKI